MLSLMAGVADIEYQKRVWIFCQGSEVDDFGETRNELSICLDIILSNQDCYKLSQEQYGILKRFYARYDSFDGYIFEVNDLQSKEWIAITQEAAQVLKAFEYPGRDKFKKAQEISPTIKNEWLQQFLHNIHHLADRDFQQRVWIEKSSLEESSYEDVTYDFFVDVHGFLKYPQEFGITDLQLTELSKFNQLFRVFGDKFGMHDQQVVKFIDTPEWKHVMEKAKELLEAFHYPVPSDSNK